MSDPDVFRITVLKPRHGLAVKRRALGPDGVIAKTDHTLNVKMWWMASVQRPNDAGHVADLLRELSPRLDIATTHGAPAPGISPSELQPRWSGEARGGSRTLLDADRSSIPIDIDKAPLPEGSALGEGQNIVALAEYVRDEILPPSFRNVELVVRASSSTGFNPTRGSLHVYPLLDRLVPLPAIYRWLKGLQASGSPVDPRPALAGQLFLSGRPELIGVADPVPEGLRVFVLPGLKRTVRGIDWNEFEPQLRVREAAEHAARAVGAGQGWRAVLDHHLGDGKDRFGFFEPLSIALGYAARSGEHADEIVGAMHAIVRGRPDLTSERADRYTQHWLRSELMRLRAKDIFRDARAAEIRRRLLPTMSFDR